MKQLKKQDLINILILIVFVNIFYFTITKNGFLYGSTTDWKDQHFMFAEYFRNLFYDTKELIPQFALNIGGGQNIFNFAYYGLFNPIILISYLFPTIKMMDYVIFSSILIVIASAILFYKLLKNNQLPSHICLIASFIFTCASPLLFHSHRHIMFINYMPFLILGLLGTDKFIKQNKPLLLTISTVLIILTSYYYSICALCVMFLYYIYKNITEEKFDIKKLIIPTLKYIYFVFIGVLIACFFLLPTFASILAGRVSTTNKINILSLLIPVPNVMNILYEEYSMGLTFISIISLIYFAKSKNKNNKVLSIILLAISIFPIFIFILNGTLYVNSKILIPFIPLVCLLIGNFIKELEEKTIKINCIIIVTLIIVLGTILYGYYDLNLMLIDIVLSLIFITFYTKKRTYLLIILALSSLLTLKNANDKDELYSIKEYNKDFNIQIEETIENIQKQDDSFYRINNNLSKLSTVNKIYNIDYYQSSLYSSTYNGLYNNFYNHVFRNEVPYRNAVINSETNNILFQIFMGEKYVITNYGNKIGYEKVDKLEHAYKNIYAKNIGFATNKTLSYDKFEKLEYPYTVEALLNNIIVDEETEDFESKIEEYNLDYLKEKINIDYEEKDGIYTFDLDEKTKIELPLENLQNKILIIRFDMVESQSCSEGDTYITINSIKNKLTCSSWRYHNKNYSFEYVLSDKTLNQLNITIEKGHYKIKDIKAYTIDEENLKNINEVDKLNITKAKSNKIEGNIDVTNDGYFMIQIPYDKGFSIYVDGKKQELLKLSTTFIGTKINEGHHDIKIIYKTPLLLIGKIISIIGIIIFIISLYINKNFEKVMNMKIVKLVKDLYIKYKEIINYLFIGGCTTIVSIVSYTIFLKVFNIHYQISNVLSWILAVAFAYVTNKIFVFNSKNKNILKELFLFVQYRIYSLLVDMLCMFILIDLIKIDDLIAKIIVQIIVVIINYVFSKLFVFKKK